MSHALDKEFIDVTGCPAPFYEPGVTYKVNGLTQTAIGTFSVLSIAVNSTQLSEDVTLLPDAEPTRAWPGIIDWTDCQLTYVHDHRNNEVAAKNNISGFPWYVNSVNGNRVNENATINMAAYTGDMRSNDFFGAFVDLNGASPLSSVSGNHFFNSTLFAANPIDLFIQGIEANTADINVTGPGNFRLFAVSIDNSGHVYQTSGGNINIERTTINGGARLDMEGDILIRDCVIGKSTLLLKPSSLLTITNSIVDSGSGIRVNGIAGSIIDQVELRIGSELRPNGFNISNSTIIDFPVTLLLAPITDGFKSGLVNAIP